MIYFEQLLNDLGGLYCPYSTPAKTWQPTIFTFQKEPLGLRVLEGVEILVKRTMFGCGCAGIVYYKRPPLFAPWNAQKDCERTLWRFYTTNIADVDETLALYLV
jgi:hypothetical protein